MKLKPYAGLSAQLLEEKLHFLDMVRIPVRRLSDSCPALLEQMRDLPGYSGVIHFEKPSKETGCPDTSEAPVRFDKLGVSPTPGGSQSSGDTGWAGSNHNDIGLSCKRNISGGHRHETVHAHAPCPSLKVDRIPMSPKRLVSERKPQNTFSASCRRTCVLQL
jgi:hypothetical protein